MKNKRQHFIPASYLEAWCDKNAPINYEPYVWLLSRNASDVKQKPPDKIFFEKELYTVKAKDGTRDLTIESNLSRLESEFVKLRRKKLDRQLRLSRDEHLKLCMFVSAMYGRTKAQGDNMKAQFGRVIEMANRLVEWSKSASPEQLKAAEAITREGPSGKEISYEEIKEMAEQPYPALLTNLVTEVAPAIFDWPMVIIQTDDALGFVSSDNPCVWLDPQLYKKRPSIGAGGLSSPTLEIFMPVSPRQIVFFGKQLVRSGIYLTATPEMESHLNRCIIANAEQSFVTHTCAVKCDWFSRQSTANS